MNSSIKGSRDFTIIDKDEYYASLKSDEGGAMKLGQFYFTHVVYPQDYPQILRLIKYNPKEESKSTFTIKHYSSGDEHHYPIKELNLRKDEMHYIYTGKIRLIIVLGYVESEWLGSDKLQKILLCAPVFSFKPAHNQEMVIRTQAFDFPNLFYFPASPNGCSQESAVRFEMVQPIMSGYLQPFYNRLNNKPIMLSEIAYRLLVVHLIKFLCGEIIDKDINKEILAYRELLLEEWQKGNIEA